MSRIINSYLDNRTKDSIVEKKIINKLLLSLVVSVIYLITYCILFWGLWIVVLISIPILFFVIIPLSLIEIKIIKLSVLRMLVTFFIQVVFPTFMLVFFDHFYGLLIVSCFFNSFILFILVQLSKFFKRK
jgi:hypothetical protein